MGAELIETSALASEILSDLDEALGKMHESDRPACNPRGELVAHAPSSNIGQAAISQPLCTAIQIILVQVLRAAGKKFSSVVGHCSGEIAAAFAAGYLSSKDAIRIAYYRGFHAHLAAGPNGVNGAMLAVGTTLEDAQNLCSDEEFSGRIRVARLQLSGQCHTLWGRGRRHVHPNRKPEDMAFINPSYWVENMRSPVLFRQALENAIASGPFDAAIEVGPHPALKGLARDIMEALQIQIPYKGTLQRKCNPVHSMSDTLGYV
ncbi:putative nrps-t1pks biosynthetic cluster [Epichloe bromicola]|uniref:Nrps-t1pks biosynthetic cluster n=1 Tax=Epichloe bromicola TaxID=79588 RepID=A0ABQ0CXD3_9HYPO